MALRTIGLKRYGSPILLDDHAEARGIPKEGLKAIVEQEELASH